MLEVAYIIVAIALVVFLVYLIITLQKVGRVIDETENTVKDLNFRCKMLLYITQTNFLPRSMFLLMISISKLQPLIHSLQQLQTFLFLSLT